ncbi:hypothetical protein DQ04_27131000, partial [Trypanosoma grayi]|uniref:hypothetical protein n=1 Tax=Trypanosoma grayi TaxID=71804 RepID=UPI0004F46488
LTNCFPSVILSYVTITYTCEVNNAQPLIDLELFASYYNPTLNPGWPATLDAETNAITFMPSWGAPSGRWELVITGRPDISSTATPQTSNKSMGFMLIAETNANFASEYPYYGMGVSFAPNL